MDIKLGRDDTGFVFCRMGKQIIDVRSYRDFIIDLICVTDPINVKS